MAFNYSKMANLGFRTNFDFVGTFLELPKLRPNLDPWNPSLLPKYAKTYNENKSFLNNILIPYINIWEVHSLILWESAAHQVFENTFRKS